MFKLISKLQIAVPSNNFHLIILSKSSNNGGISERSDFVSRNRDIYLSFILNCRSDYLVDYPQKEQRIYKTKLSMMKITF